MNTSSVLRKVEEEEAVQGTRLETYTEISGLDLTFSKVRLRSLDWHLREFHVARPANPLCLTALSYDTTHFLHVYALHS